MAIFLQFDKRQQSPSGLIQLKRGDDWSLKGQIVEKISRVTEPFDLTGCQATAFFEASTGGTIHREVTLTNETCGVVEIDVPATGENNTTEVATDETGTTIYCTIQHPTRGLFTVENELPILEIKDREFIEN